MKQDPSFELIIKKNQICIKVIKYLNLKMFIINEIRVTHRPT